MSGNMPMDPKMSGPTGTTVTNNADSRSTTVTGMASGAANLLQKLRISNQGGVPIDAGTQIHIGQRPPSPPVDYAKQALEAKIAALQAQILDLQRQAAKTNSALQSSNNNVSYLQQQNHDLFQRVKAQTPPQQYDSVGAPVEGWGGTQKYRFDPATGSMTPVQE